MLLLLWQRHLEGAPLWRFLWKAQQGCLVELQVTGRGSGWGWGWSWGWRWGQRCWGLRLGSSKARRQR